MTDWITPGTRRPKPGEEVLLSFGKEVMPGCRISGRVWCDVAGVPFPIEPEAWMPYPEPYRRKDGQTDD